MSCEFELFRGSVELLPDGSLEMGSKWDKAEDEDGEVGLELRLCCVSGTSGSEGGFILLSADLIERFEMLELAEDRFEGGERPLAKSRRAAAALSAARTVGERPFWLGACSLLLYTLEPWETAAVLLEDAIADGLSKPLYLYFALLRLENG